MWVWVRPTLGGGPMFLLLLLTKVCGKQGGNQYSLSGMAPFKRNKTCQLAEVSPDKGKISSLSGSWARAEQDQARTATTTAALWAYYYCTIWQATLFIPNTSPQLSAGHPFLYETLSCSGFHDTAFLVFFLLWPFLQYSLLLLCPPSKSWHTSGPGSRSPSPFSEYSFSKWSYLAPWFQVAPICWCLPTWNFSSPDFSLNSKLIHVKCDNYSHT